jgi:UDP-N-acetylmuramate dehydrogenase
LQFLKENISLHKYTTYKVGGKAKYFAEPSNLAEIQEVLQWRKKQNLPLFILGKGSNLVVSDSGFEGLILYFGRSFKKIQIDGAQIYAEAGALLHSLVQKSVNQGLVGMENLGGIPGTIGGGVYINAGAFDQELDQSIIKVTSITCDGDIKVRSTAECGFGYRHSNFFQLNEIILSAEFALNQSEIEKAKNQFNHTLQKRKGKQPLEYPNAGSMYKRPPGTFAGKLIQEANLKGFALGGAQISPKHANFVINANNATSQDIYDLSEEVKNQVLKNSGIELEKEQIFLGEFLPYPR